jgi:hypothetical protein
MKTKDISFLLAKHKLCEQHGKRPHDAAAKQYLFGLAFPLKVDAMDADSKSPLREREQITGPTLA